MAAWDYNVKPTPLKKAPKPRKSKVPKLRSLKATPVKKPKAKAQKPPKAPQPPKAWYDPSQTARRDATIASAFDDPLAPLSGDAAQAFARALVAARSAPVAQEYDRAEAVARSRHAAQKTAATNAAVGMQGYIASQLATQQATRGAAQQQARSAALQRDQSVDAATAAAQAQTAEDQRIRGGSMDGGAAAAKFAQEQASAKARGAQATEQWSQRQAADAGSADALLTQIAAATAQQGGERQGALDTQLNNQVRDANQGRAKNLASAQSDYISTLMGLQSQGIQTKLATETLGLNKEKATADSLAKQAALAQQAQIASLNAKIKVTEGAEQRALRKQLQSAQDRQRTLDRAARVGTADANRSAADRRAAAAAKKTTGKGGAATAKLTPKDKQRRELITSVQTAQAAGDLATLKKRAKSPSEFRTMLLESQGVRDKFTRQLLADLSYGGLRPQTVAAYKARYGRNPPSGWKRYKAPKPSAGGGLDGFAGAVGGSVGIG